MKPDLSFSAQLLVHMCVYSIQCMYCTIHSAVMTLQLLRLAVNWLSGLAYLWFGWHALVNLCHIGFLDVCGIFTLDNTGW